jgi:predicted PurR-regulated permease PerM
MKTDSALPSATLPAAEERAADPPPARALPPAREAPEAAVPSSGPPPVPPPLAPFSPRTRVRVLAVVAFLAFLFLVRVGGILTPFLWAVVVAYAFNPLVALLCRRTGLPRSVIVVAAYLIVIGVFAALLSVAIPRLNEQITQLANDLPLITQDLLTRYGGTTSQPLQIGPLSINVLSVARQIAGSLNGALDNFVGGSFTAVITTIERLTQFLLFLIVSFYLLLDAPKIGRYFAVRIPRTQREEVLDLAHQVDTVLSQYLRAQLILIGLMSTAAFIVLSIMGVRFAIILAPIAGTLEIFPIIGPIAAITLVTLIALFSPTNFGLSHTTSALIVALTFFVLRQIEDYAVIPNVVGHAVRLHPALILFAVATGATFGGALGLFLAVPVTGALKVLGGYLYRKLDLA